MWETRLSWVNVQLIADQLLCCQLIGIKKERIALFLTLSLNQACSMRTYLELSAPKRFLNLSTRPPVSAVRCLPV
jgi:hypothetical protein